MMKQLLFKITNVISIVLAVSALFAIGYSHLFILDKVAPDYTIEFTEIESQINEKENEKKPSSEITNRNEQLTVLISKYDLGEENYKVIYNMGKNYTEVEQKDFYRGMETALAAQAQLKKENPDYTIDKFMTVNTYRDLFAKNYKDLNPENIENKVQAFIASLILIIAVLMFVVFMAVPVLIQIEKNTRLQK